MAPVVLVGSLALYVTGSFPEPIVHENANGTSKFSGECNVFVGNWVPDESYPLYNASDVLLLNKVLVV